MTNQAEQRGQTVVYMQILTLRVDFKLSPENCNPLGLKIKTTKNMYGDEQELFLHLV